ncbi:MAG: hypothetical protein U9N12_07730 [Euryarchaeota archaeon]|nr:hypothetical protein [Euryarchaeota archaeon]
MSTIWHVFATNCDPVRDQDVRIGGVAVVVEVAFSLMGRLGPPSSTITPFSGRSSSHHRKLTL